MLFELPQDGVLTNRRRFIAGTLAAGASLTLPWSRRALALGANGKLNVAAFGVGGMGGADVNSVASHPDAVMTLFCDVDANILKGAVEKYSTAKPFSDWREAIGTSKDTFDAAIVSTPDHSHAPIAMSCLNAGKAVYCQKPLTHSIYEARMLREAAAKARVATQMGIQGQAKEGRRDAVGKLMSGRYGKLVGVHIWTNRPAGWWPQGQPRPEGSDPVPDSLNWNCWLGVAPERPWKKDTYNPFKWRGFLDFGTGAMGDMGCHFFDTPTAGLSLGAPISAMADIEGESDDQWPLAETITLTFDGSKIGAEKTFQLKWYDGGRVPTASVSPHLPEDWKPPADQADGGMLVVGTDATVYHAYSGETKIFPESAKDNFPMFKLSPLNHWHNWVDSAMGKGSTAANFDFAGPMTETVLLGTIAARFPGTELHWDAKAMKVTNLEAANALVKPTYRAGFKVAGLDC